MNQTDVLNRYFRQEERGGWTALFALDECMMKGFQTKRLAKMYGADIYFTVGETQKGRRNRLTATIEEILRRQAIPMQKIDSTQGNVGSNKVYTGFNLRHCTPGQLEIVVAAVIQAVRACS